MNKSDVPKNELDPAQTTIEPTDIGSTTHFVNPTYTRNDVTNLFVSPLYDIKSVKDKGDTLEYDDTVLSNEQLLLVLLQLKDQLQKTRSSRAEGATFEAVKKIVEGNPDLAKQVHAMILMGAKPDVVILTDTRIVLDDLRTDDEVSPQEAIKAELAVLKAIPDLVKNRIIIELRSEYPNIPDGEFERLETNLSGPSYWESLLLTRAKKLKIMPPDDYRATQYQSSEKDRLDMKGISWLAATDEQLKGGIAPNGCRDEVDVCVGVNGAEGRSDNCGVRARAEGSVS